MNIKSKIVIIVLIFYSIIACADDNLNNAEIKYNTKSNVSLNDLDNNENIIFKCYDGFFNQKFHYGMMGGKVQVRGIDSPNICYELYSNSDKFIDIFKKLNPTTSNLNDSKKRISFVFRKIENQERKFNIVEEFICERDSGKFGWITDACDKNLIKIIENRFYDFNKLFRDQNDFVKQKNDLIKLENKKLFKFDVVTKVLNYSSGLGDDGQVAAFWYAEDSDNCIYNYAFNDDKKFKILKLNELDPRLIKITVNNNASIVLYDNKTLTSTRQTLDFERLNRGWSLIYSKYCKGIQKDF